MKDSITQAEVSCVKVGHLEIEGLMDTDGKFAVAVPQICQLFQILSKNASRDIKALLGKDFQFLKYRTELHPKAVNALTLIDFERLLRKLDKASNPVAESICDDLVGLSLHQLFSDAFHVKFESDERQEHLKVRQESKLVRHNLTDAIKWYLNANADTLSNSYVNFIYPNCSDLVNLGLFGRKSKRLCVDLKISDRSKLRDALKADELRWLTEIEDLAARLIVYQDYEPMDAVKEAISRVAIPVVDRTA
jgi:hypothetical protein